MSINMYRRCATLITIGFLLAFAAMPASAAAPFCPSDHFCGFKDANFEDEIFESGREPNADNLTVSPNDALSSWDNDSDDYWCAVNNGFPSDTTIFWAPPHTDNGYVGNADNDKTDHFYVRGAEAGC